MIFFYRTTVTHSCIKLYRKNIKLSLGIILGAWYEIISEYKEYKRL